MQIIGLWLFRRALEMGGIIGAILAAWNGLPPGIQDAVLMLLSRNWENITLGALIPIAVAAWGYIWSFISSIRPQVVADGKQIMIEAGSTAESKVKVIAQSAPKPRTLLEHLADKLAKR